MSLHHDLLEHEGLAELVASADEAFRAWGRVRATDEARAFLVLLPFGKRWNR